MEKAQDQIAMAAAMALYNRCLLKIERDRDQKECIEPEKVHEAPGPGDALGAL